MKFVQSRFQDFFSRSYEALCFLGYFALFSVSANLLFSIELGIQKEILLVLVVMLVTFIYLRLNYKFGSLFLDIADNEIIFKNRHLVTRIAKKDFQGYRITKYFPHRIVIKNKVYGETIFSYYAFSSKQREQIFERLNQFPMTNTDD